MPDLHATAPSTGRFRLQQVGVAGIQKPLSVQRPERVVTLSAVFGATVDLPSSRKGSDLSRNAELLAELVDETANQPATSLESACSRISRELLVRHPYALQSTATASADYFVPRGYRGSRTSLEPVRLFADASARRSDEGAITVRRWVGVESVGMTACPCAMETSREQLAERYPLLRDPSLAGLPMITHNQRNRTRLSVELPEGMDVEADRLIDAVEAAQSSPTYAILKRGDEAAAVLDAHLRPRFVEDVIRGLLASLPERFPSLPDSVEVRARTVSEESIHKYDVVADHSATLGELRRASGA